MHAEHDWAKLGIPQQNVRILVRQVRTANKIISANHERSYE